MDGSHPLLAVSYKKTPSESEACNCARILASNSGEGGAGGVGGGVGTGGVGGLGGGTGTGGVGGGVGVSGQSLSPEQLVPQEVVHNPPDPPSGYPPQLEASPHLLQQHFLLDAGPGVGAGGVGTAGVGDGAGVGDALQLESFSQLTE